MMRDLSQLRDRLRQAGLKPASELPTPPPKPAAIPPDWPGRIVSSPRGDYYLIERHYPLGHSHGDRSLSPINASADLPRLFRLPADVLPDRMVFMDTETTGLAGGAGTFAFLVGTGSFDPEGFHIRQYFLPDPAGEAALLEDALAEMEAGAVLVTFNGRAFDVPILQARTTLRLRRFDALTRIAHLDLLTHARRLWRRKLESCALSALEREMLGVRRSIEDVPSSLIPFLYREYLRTGDPVQMTGVLYHNAVDILSMATLIAGIHERYLLPPAEIPDPLEALSLAFSFRQEDRPEFAEDAFRTALRGNLPAGQRADALKGLAALFKQKHTVDQALVLWEEWHTLDPDTPEPCVELAKHYEWREKDYRRALAWAEEALVAAGQINLPSLRNVSVHAAEHRIQRLMKKL